MKKDMNWINNVNVGELDKSVFAEYEGLTYEELGQELAFQNNLGEFGLSDKGQIWDTLKNEFKKLICEKDEKYEDLRSKLNEFTSKGSTAVIATLSAGLGSMIGASAAAISPLITILVIATIKIGKELFCSLQNLNIKIKD